MSSPAFVVPGHHEPLSAWSTERLKSAIEDFSFDLAGGYLPEDAAREVLDHISRELERREQGTARDEPATGHFAGGRALETWFGKEEERVPALRGAPEGFEEARRPDVALTPAPQTGPHLAQERDQGLDP